MTARIVLCVVGARPNFMKIGPVINALRLAGFAAPLVHTGQHYDARMYDQVFADLSLPEPDFNLGVGSGSHASQTGEVMVRFEPVLDEVGPDAVLVVGDVNSTLACALVAAKKGVKVVHVEAGLRSFDRTMPEEINRVLTDQISDLLFLTERSALANLEREGIDPAKAYLVGNVMIDTLLANVGKAIPARQTLAPFGLDAAAGFGLVTMHRPSNVDDHETLATLLGSLRRMAERLPLAFPMHPRTHARIAAFGLSHLLEGVPVAQMPPASYHEILGLTREARIVFTDSGGLQEESTALGIPCLTLRRNTERPVTVEAGTNTLVGTDPAGIEAAFADVLATGGKRGRIPPYWDGKAGGRIAAILDRTL